MMINGTSSTGKGSTSLVELIRFRRWWQPPHPATDRPEERRITFLALFYDLVYVVIIAQLSHTLAEDISPAGIGSFIFLFTIVWWAGFNGAMYHDLHGNYDIRTRVFTFLQMFTVAAMAIFAHNAMGAGSAGFALAYASNHLILTWLWWRTGVYYPNHRPLSQPYSSTFLITSALFVLSIFIPAPWRFVLWADPRSWRTQDVGSGGVRRFAGQRNCTIRPSRWEKARRQANASRQHCSQKSISRMLLPVFTTQ